MYWDYYILGIILLPGVIFALYAEIKIKNTYNKFSTAFAECGKTAKEVARLFLDTAGLTDINIVRVKGELTDYYHHKKKIIALSDSVIDSQSISAIGVACHEVGHALQYQSGYFPIKLRNFIIPICNFANRALWFILILGALFYYTNLGLTFLWIGVGVFGITVLLNLITLPIEYNASKRALELLQKSTVFNEEETECTKKVLNAAALTYVASLVVSILNLLRLVLTIIRIKDRD